MFDSMDSHIIDTFVEVSLFHTVSVFLNQAEGSFDAGSEGFQLFVDSAVR